MLPSTAAKRLVNITSHVSHSSLKQCSPTSSLRTIRSHSTSGAGATTSANNANVRTETDTFGPIGVPADKYWGAQTQR